jgi:hypothetical protein
MNEKKSTPEGLWRRKTVDLGGGCRPTRLVVSAPKKNGEDDPELTDYLMGCRHVMCRSHFRCLHHAGEEDWDGFDCSDCPSLNDPENRIAGADMVEEIQNLLLLRQIIETQDLKPPPLPNSKNHRDPARKP